jgi:hypothetical protein
MPPFGIALVTYIGCGGLLWIVAHTLAPLGYHITLLRGIGAVVLITIFGELSSIFLKPVIGECHALVRFIVDVLIVRAVMYLTFWRSVLVVVVYTIALLVTVHLLFGRTQRAAATPTESPIVACVYQERLL